MSGIRTLVLIHSPLTGPGTWRALAPALQRRGFRVIVPDLRDALRADPPLYFRIRQSAAEAMAGVSGEMALVVHSGAGALVPVLARSNKNIRRAIFLDALLPHPGRCWFDSAPGDLAAHLRSLAKGGRLPRWHRWWPRRTIETLIPDETQRAEFIAELQEVPLAYLEEAAPLGDVPNDVVCSYLQLSSACKADADGAERRGWPVRRLDLNHLATLTHAADVEAALLELLDVTGEMSQP